MAIRLASELAPELVGWVDNSVIGLEFKGGIVFVGSNGMKCYLAEEGSDDEEILTRGLRVPSPNLALRLLEVFFTLQDKVTFEHLNSNCGFELV